MTDILTPEEYVQKHQKAFRCAFDFLNKHFPPEDTPEWWEQACKDVVDASVSQGENNLVVRMLGAVYDYLDDERRIRHEAGNQ